MAGTIACAAFGARRFWQDLGASGRPEVTLMMERHFPTLAAINVRHLKWERHSCVTLGERIGQPGPRPPRCDACEEQPLSFPAGPTEVRFRRIHGGPAPEEEQAT